MEAELPIPSGRALPVFSAHGEELARSLRQLSGFDSGGSAPNTSEPLSSVQQQHVQPPPPLSAAAGGRLSPRSRPASGQVPGAASSGPGGSAPAQEFPAPPDKSGASAEEDRGHLLSWLKSTLRRKRVGSSRLMGLMDDNRSGGATYNEFVTGLAAVDIDLVRGQYMRLFKAVDDSGDRCVSMEELRAKLYDHTHNSHKAANTKRSKEKAVQKTKDTASNVSEASGGAADDLDVDLTQQPLLTTPGGVVPSHDCDPPANQSPVNQSSVNQSPPQPPLNHPHHRTASAPQCSPHRPLHNPSHHPHLPHPHPEARVGGSTGSSTYVNPSYYIPFIYTLYTHS